MNDISPVVRPLQATATPISPAKFAHFVLRTGQFDKQLRCLPVAPRQDQREVVRVERAAE